MMLPSMQGWTSLFYKEILRFWKVGFQTVAAPVMTAVLYLLIFGHVLEDHVQVFDGVGYTRVLGARSGDDERAAKRVCQQLVQPGAKQDHGQCGVHLLTPLSHWAWFCAYVGSSIVRGLVVGLGVYIVTLFFTPAARCCAAVDAGVCAAGRCACWARWG